MPNGVTSVNRCFFTGRIESIVCNARKQHEITKTIFASCLHTRRLYQQGSHTRSHIHTSFLSPSRYRFFILCFYFICFRSMFFVFRLVDHRHATIIQQWRKTRRGAWRFRRRREDFDSTCHMKTGK